MKSPNIDFGVVVPISKIKVFSSNPKPRTSARNIKAIRENIQENGLRYPLSLTKDFRLADGHRRLESIKELGWTEVVCNIHKDFSSPAALFSILNKDTRKLVDRDWMELYSEGYREEVIPKKVLNLTAKLEDIAGDDLFKELVTARASPGILNVVQETANFLNWNTKKQLKEILEWLFYCRTQKEVRSALCYGNVGRSTVALAIEMQVKLSEI